MHRQAFLTEKTQKSMNNKANKFLEYGCISEVDFNVYQCRPLIGYNIHTYTIHKQVDDTYRCNCQGFKKNNYCSHIEAVRIFIARNSNKSGERQETFCFRG